MKRRSHAVLEGCWRPGVGRRGRPGRKRGRAGREGRKQAFVSTLRDGKKEKKKEREKEGERQGGREGGKAYLSAVSHQGPTGPHDVGEDEPGYGVGALRVVYRARVDVHAVLLVLVGEVEGGGRLGGWLSGRNEGGREGGREGGKVGLSSRSQCLMFE